MCGIVGVVSLRREARIDRAAVDKLTDGLRHRGPDARGTLHHERFSFGHTRLSVIDPEPRSNQPFLDRDKIVTLVFNGEIYNYVELRRELVGRGVEFLTESDTEVLAEAYKCFGLDFLARLNGIFALALHDARSGEVLLARDRLGVKPLLFARHRDLLLFASEAKGILGYPGFERRIRPEAISSFLALRQARGSEHFFRGVQRLAPGHLLCLRGDRIREARYWDLSLNRTRGRIPVDAFRRLFRDAVALQCRSDVPVAALLSGGLDSSILVTEATRSLGRQLTCFTARIAEQGFDESAYAQEVTEACGLRLRIVPVHPPKDLSASRRLIRMKDQPLGMHNELAVHCLAESVAREAKVVLCGEGADECFAGYGRIFRSPFEFRRARALRRPPADFADFFWARYEYWPAGEKLPLFRPEFAAAIRGDEALRALVRDVFNRASSRDRVAQVSYFLLKVHLPALLEMLDAMTMAASIEARVPFTDHRLVQAAFDLPASQKLRWRSPLGALCALREPVARFSEQRDETKVILRRIYGRRLPAAVVGRLKMGFPVPLSRWLLGPVGDEVRDLLLADGARLHEYFDPGKLRAWLSAAGRAVRDEEAFGKRLWLLVNLGLFLEEYA